MNIDIEQLKKKIIYRSNYRGTKEMDKLLGAFTKEYIDRLDLNDLVDLDKKNFHIYTSGCNGKRAIADSSWTARPITRENAEKGIKTGAIELLALLPTFLLCFGIFFTRARSPREDNFFNNDTHTHRHIYITKPPPPAPLSNKSLNAKLGQYPFPAILDLVVLSTTPHDFLFSPESRRPVLGDGITKSSL